MSTSKWTRGQSESGILRKSEFKEKKEELFVFGYSCKLFRDDHKALHIDQGKHLIPWMGDETLKIDRYDARGALHDLSTLEAPPGGYDWRIELTKTEQEVEQLCDEERYRALHTDEDEEEMYKEEELKRLHAAGYGQVGFNYDTPAEASPSQQTAEVDELFEPSESFKALLPKDIVLPETQKQNAIIEKTAKFIALQGAQMEILIKAKQRDNPQFQFLNRDSPLNMYYMVLISLVKSGKWPEKPPEAVEEKHTETDEYLHPSLASTIIELAPSIPSIQYKPSADCDYTMLVSKMRGDDSSMEATEDSYSAELAPGEEPPPGTEPYAASQARDKAQISRAPVMYTAPQTAGGATQEGVYGQQYAAYYHTYMAQAEAARTAQTAQQVQPERPKDADQPQTTLKSTGLSLMKNYNTDSDSDDSDYDTSSTDSKDTKQQVIKPPEDVRVVIDKMAAYVARNGDEFADIVRAKNDPRFTFLDPDNEYHAYYKQSMHEKRGLDVNGKDKKKSKAPVSFSIKKQKEPDAILPKPALPYESSSDDDSEKATEKAEDNGGNSPKINPLTHQQPMYSMNSIPQAVVYKMDGLLTQDLASVRTIETTCKVSTPKIVHVVPEVVEVATEVLTPRKENESEKTDPEVEEISPPIIREEKIESERIERIEKSPKREKKRYKDKKKESKSDSRRESRHSERREKEKREKEDRNRKKTKSKVDIESDIVISLEDNSDEMIDLTGDLSDAKVECETEAERAKQVERRRRAAEFLKKVGVDPAAAALPTSSLASAMVDTLESLRRKKAEEEAKRRRREKRKHRERRGYELESERSHRKSKRRKYRSTDEDESDYEGSKKKKRKRDKKHSKNKRRKREDSSEDDEEDQPLPANIDLTNTLKELRNSSPTKELVLRVEKQSDGSSKAKKKKKDREYSEGECPTDSEEDSVSSAKED